MVSTSFGYSYFDDYFEPARNGGAHHCMVASLIVGLGRLSPSQNWSAPVWEDPGKDSLGGSAGLGTNGSGGISAVHDAIPGSEMGLVITFDPYPRAMAIAAPAPLKLPSLDYF